MIITLTAFGASQPVVFRIDQDRFLIGTKRDAVDGLITFNNRVSKRHCEILRTEDAFFVKDVGSSNGTKLNGKRIMPDQRFPLKDGDSIRLADLEFAVRIERS